MSVARTQYIILLELMLPFDSWFCIFFLQILKVVVYQMAMISFVPTPTEQFGLSEVCYTPPINFSIHCGAPLFVGLQVNEPYFAIIIVPYHNLLRTDHINKNLIQIFTFHFLLKQNFSVGVSVENKYSTLSNVLNVLLSSLLLH